MKAKRTCARLDALGGSTTEGRSYTDPLDLIRDLLHDRTQVTVPGLPRFVGGLVGYIGYETVCAFERLPVAPTDDLQVPNGLLLGVDSLVAFDHVQQAMHRDRAGRHRADRRRRARRLPAGHEPDRDAYQPPPRPGAAAPSPPSPHVERGQGGEARPSPPLPGVPLASAPALWPTCRRWTSSTSLPGERSTWRRATSSKWCLASGSRGGLDATPFNVYRALRMVNPSSYMYYLHLDDMYLVGASPETMVQVEDGYVRTRPIAGTRPRGATPEEDQALGEGATG